MLCIDLNQERHRKLLALRDRFADAWKSPACGGVFRHRYGIQRSTDTLSETIAFAVWSYIEKVYRERGPVDVRPKEIAAKLAPGAEVQPFIKAIARLQAQGMIVEQHSVLGASEGWRPATGRSNPLGTKFQNPLDEVPQVTHRALPSRETMQPAARKPSPLAVAALTGKSSRRRPVASAELGKEFKRLLQEVRPQARRGGVCEQRGQINKTRPAKPATRRVPPRPRLDGRGVVTEVRVLRNAKSTGHVLRRKPA